MEKLRQWPSSQNHLASARQGRYRRREQRAEPPRGTARRDNRIYRRFVVGFPSIGCLGTMRWAVHGALWGLLERPSAGIHGDATVLDSNIWRNGRVAVCALSAATSILYSPTMKVAPAISVRRCPPHLSLAEAIWIQLCFRFPPPAEGLCGVAFHVSRLQLRIVTPCPRY